MEDIKLRAVELLTADATLMGLLGMNHPVYYPEQPASKAASIVDFTQASKLENAPFLTVRLNDASLVGAYHLTNAFLLVRCYNEKDKSFYTINKALSRVQQILNGKRFDVNGYNVVEVRWETTRAELPDDGLDMNYREQQFRIQLT